jgi:Asp-tRNA(Asn)/Glu-tRNA(Gln) amidotransferase A subunit family amidase
LKFDRRNFIASSALASATLLAPRAFAMSGGLSEADYLKLDAMEIADLVRRKKISPTDALNAAIARADKVNPAINAITIRLEGLARKAIAEGLPEKGPLRGVPFLLKDLGARMAGTITSEGSRFFRDAVADHDGTLVQRYRAAGLVIWGKTASPEFGATGTTESLLWGATHNPWNLKHSAGGSSGGAAAAVAAGIVPAAHASDGGGSIRIPASNCGLFGMKPSRGRTPLGPDALESWMGLTANHAISRTVRDSAILLDIASGPEAGSRNIPPGSNFLDALKGTPKRLRIALMQQNPFGVPLAAECQVALDHAAKLCEELGHHVEPASISIPVGPMMEGMSAITGAGTLALIRDREKALGRAVTKDDLEPINWDAYQEARKYTVEDLYRGRAVADQVGRIFDEFLTRFDVIVSPVMAVPPPLLGALSLNQARDNFVKNAIAVSCFTAMYNIAGLPAMSVPLHWTSEGLPVGTMFAGRYGAEITLFQLAAQLEKAAPWLDRRPVI